MASTGNRNTLPFEHCWRHKHCEKLCPVRETGTVFCWRLAQKESLCHPSTCHQCSYRQNWMSKRYDLQEYLTRSDRDRGRPWTRRILAVDDDPDFLFCLEETIHDLGCTILTAMDGEEGLLFAQETRPDLVITDIKLPRLNGLDLCRALKADGTTSGIPIIMVSVLASVREQEEGMRAGASAYLVKPMHLQDLTSRILGLLPDSVRPRRS